MATNYEVVQAQRDFADAQNNELRAILNYRKALVNFDTVQTVGSRGDRRGGHGRRADHGDEHRRRGELGGTSIGTGATGTGGTGTGTGAGGIGGGGGL